jgi:acyl-coenzyme A synthetase/AMP-(fatty) acid ligase
MLYTAGTTGNPKAISYSLQDRLDVMSRHNINYKHRSLSVSPLYHIAGINWLENNLQCGHQLFLLPTFDTKAIIKSIEKHKITQLSLVAPVMTMLLQEKELLDKTDLTSVKHILLTSTSMNKKSISQIKQYFPNAKKIFNPYGLTEMPMGVFGNHPSLPTPEFSVGYPLPGLEIKLVDGVLHIKTSHIASSVKNSITDSYYNTRDKFSVDENGFYFFEGRSDTMVKVGGESVYPEEIQDMLSQHPNIIDAAVIFKPDEIKNFKPHAYVTINNSITEQEIIAWASNKLAPYQIPKSISIVNDIPKTSIGKIDYTKLGK